MKKFIVSIIMLTCTFMSPWMYTPSSYAHVTTESSVIARSDEKVTIMWDLGETLFSVNHMGMFKELGLDALTYIILDAHFNTSQIQHKIFEVLTLIGGEQEGPEEFKCKHNGTVNLPRNMALWLAGAHDDPYAWVQELEEAIDHLNDKGYFISKREYRLIRRAVRAMFAPEILIKHLKPIKKMFKILEQVRESGHEIMVLSNWDAVSFDLFLQTRNGEKLRQYVDDKNIVISGKIGLNKPHPSFFEYVLHTYNLNPAHCILIDNDCANCATAESCGIAALCFTGDTKEIEKELTNRNILK